MPPRVAPPRVASCSRSSGPAVCLGPDERIDEGLPFALVERRPTGHACSFCGRSSGKHIAAAAEWHASLTGDDAAALNAFDAQR